MKHLTKIFAVAFLLIISQSTIDNNQLKAQDIHFSQFSASPLILNPATTGAFNGDIRAVTNYRNQWSSIASPFKTYSIGFDMSLFKKKFDNSYMGAGIYIYNDVAGDLNLSTLQGNISIAYHINLNKHNRLAAGLAGGFAQRSIAQGNMQWDSQYDGTGFNSTLSSEETISFQNINNGDFGAGVLWRYHSKEKYMTSNYGLKINLGMSLFHLKNNMSFYDGEKDELLSKYVIHGDASIGIPNTNIALLPGGVFYNQGPLKEILFGTLVRYRLTEESKYTDFRNESAISLGGYYRLNDAIIPTIQIEISNYAIGMSYDVNTSGLTKVSNGKGGFEIFIRFINPNPFKYGRGSSLL